MTSRGPRDVEELIAAAAGLRRLAVRLVGESDADDVVQDALAAGIEHAPGGERALRPWLVRVVRNFAAGRHRSEGRRAARETDVARREPLPAAGDLVERMEVQRVVAEEVLRLDEPYRTAVLAVYFEGVGAEEYARGLGVPSATVRSWLKRGLDTLRARLDRRFGGDRAAWSACLLPLARAEAAVVPLAIGGGLLMKKLVAAAAIVALALVGAWWWSPGSANAPLAGDPPRPAALVDLPDPAADASATVASDPRPADAARGRTVLATAASVLAPASIAGRLTWTPDGAPAVDVGVRLVRVPYDSRTGAPPQSLTDRDGRFRFEPVDPGEYRLQLDRSTVSAKVRVEAGESLEVPLTAPRATDVVGRVLDPDGTAVPGAEVHIREATSPWTRLAAIAGADGSYRVESVDGWTSFFARAPGRAPSGLRQASLHESRTIDLYLGGPSGHVSGRVVDSDGNPSAGVLVRFVSSDGNGVDPAGSRVSSEVSREVRTDADGRFQMRDTPPGAHTVQAHAPGHPLLFVAVDVRPGRTTDLVIELPRTARVRGRVADAAGRALEGAIVRVSSRGERAIEHVGSDADGRFDTGCVPAGRVRLVASHEEGADAVLDVDLAAGADFEWSPTIRPLRSIRGRLLDLAGRSLAGRSILFSAGKDRTATTDADGRFAFEHLKEQPYGLYFTDGPLSARVEGVVPGQDEVVLVAEIPSARILGRLTDADGKPLAGAQLECDRSIARTATDGTFEFKKVRSGDQPIDLRGTRLQRFTLATVAVGAGELHDTGALVVPGNGSLAVRVRSDEGVPIGWTTPVVRRVGEGSAFLSQRGWDERGTWVVEELPAGEYELFVRDGGAALQRQAFSVRAGERTELAVDLRFGSTVEIDVAAAADALPLRDVVIEVLGTGGELAGRESWSSVTGATSTTMSVTLAPGAYELVARAKDGRSGRARVQVPPHGGNADIVRIELR